MTDEDGDLPPETAGLEAIGGAEQPLLPPESVGSGHRRAFVLLPATIAAVSAVAYLGIAGWRGGPLIAASLLAVMLGPIAVVLTRRVRQRWAYLAGAGVLALAGLGVAVDTAPWSHGRIDERVQDVTFPFAETVASSRSGHGWCSPTCPTVVRELRLRGRPATAIYEIAVVALDAAGLVPQDARRTFLSRALSYEGLDRDVVIDHQRFTTTVRLREDSDGAVVRIEVMSRRGFKAQPDAPRLLPA